MTQADKLLEKMHRNQRDFFHAASGRALSVPAKKPVKPVCAQAFVALQDDIGAK